MIRCHWPVAGSGTALRHRSIMSGVPE
jgi:hypothetical protein